MIILHEDGRVEKTTLANHIRNRKQQITGLGDVVAIVAEPIARAFFAAAGKKYTGCTGCDQRRETLNRAFPLTPPQ